MRDAVQRTSADCNIFAVSISFSIYLDGIYSMHIEYRQKLHIYVRMYRCTVCNQAEGVFFWQFAEFLLALDKQWVFYDIYNALRVDKFDSWVHCTVCKVSSGPLAGALNKHKNIIKILKTR